MSSGLRAVRRSVTSPVSSSRTSEGPERYLPVTSSRQPWSRPSSVKVTGLLSAGHGLSFCPRARPQAENNASGT
eukprot:3485212-Rhodomonas_salina.2